MPTNNHPKPLTNCKPTSGPRTIAIGDVHGCSTALRTLIEAIGPGPQDTIVTLGDNIDRGPDSRGVLEQLIALSKRCELVPLMGNHEEMLLAALDSRSELRFWLDCGGKQALPSYGGRETLDLSLAALRAIIPRGVSGTVYAGRYERDLCR